MAATAVWTVPAKRFHDSVGVGTHPTYFDTVHEREADIAAAIAALGIGHVRNGMQWSKNAGWNAAAWERMAAWGKAGIRSSWSVDRCALAGSVAEVPGMTMEKFLAKISEIDPLAPTAIEGTNEANMFCGGTGWEAKEVAHTQALQRAVRSSTDPRVKGLPIFGPSFAYGPQRGVGDLSPYITHANLHPYMGGEPPTRDRIYPQIGQYSLNFGTRPPVATECGYHTATAQARNPDGSPKSGAQAAVDEHTQAIYTVRQLLQNFHETFVRTYLYEAVDLRSNLADSESNFGLLRNDLTPKPAALAVKRLLAAVGNSSPATVNPLRLGVVKQPAGTQALAFQRRGGSYALAVWRQESCWDRLKQQRINVPLGEMSLDVPQARTVTAVVPTGSGSVDLPVRAGRVVLVLGEAPVVLTIRQ